MFFKAVASAIVLTIMIAAYQCSSALRVPTAPDAEAKGIPLDTLKSGRALYIGSCGSCHNLYLPGKYTAKEWQAYVAAMQQPAKIGDRQAEKILQYVTLHCKKE